MNTKPFKILFLALFILGLKATNSLAAPNRNFLPNLFLNQAALGGLPNRHAALFQFFNPSDDPVAQEISLRDAFSGPVELESGESAFGIVGWFMFAVEGCENQTVRQVIDFESPQCLVPDPEQTDPNTLLNAIASLPEECLAPALADPCGLFEGPLHLDFGTSLQGVREVLKNEISLGFVLDGSPLPPDRTRIKYFNYLLGGGNPDEASACSEDLYYSPIYAYFFYGYQIPSQTGKCVAKGSGVLLPTLTQGEHEFLFLTSINGEPLDFPPVTIIQH